MRRVLPVIAILVLDVTSLSANAQKLQRTHADSLLHSLIGHWQGKGTSFGIAVEDKISFDTTIRGRFLFMKLAAITGDEFIAEGYLWYNPDKQQVEFYEFNDGAWPVRILTGKAEGNKILLEEKIANRHIRISFLISQESFVLTEAKIIDGKEEIFVNETFARIK